MGGRRYGPFDTSVRRCAHQHRAPDWTDHVLIDRSNTEAGRGRSCDAARAQFFLSHQIRRRLPLTRIDLSSISDSGERKRSPSLLIRISIPAWNLIMEPPEERVDGYFAPAMRESRIVPKHPSLTLLAHSCPDGWGETGSRGLLSLVDGRQAARVILWENERFERVIGGHGA